MIRGRQYHFVISSVQRLLLVSLWIFLLNSCLVFAAAAKDAPLRFGPEFTFTKPGLWTGDEESFYDEKSEIWKIQKEFVAEAVSRAKELFGDGAVSVTKSLDRHDSNQFILRVKETPLVFYITVDPAVIEIPMDPLTKEEYQKYQKELGGIIWGTARKIGLYPSRTEGGGHISMSGGGITDNPLLLRNLLVLFYNYHDVFAHHFGLPEDFKGGNNSGFRHPYSTTHAKEKRFLDLIRRFDSGRIRTYKSLVKNLNKINVNSSADREFRGSRYSVWNFLHLKPSVKESKRRLEGRFFVAQTSMKHFLMDLTLLEGMVRVADIPVPIALEPTDFSDSPDYKRIRKRLRGVERLFGIRWKSRYPSQPHRSPLSRKKGSGVCRRVLSGIKAPFSRLGRRNASVRKPVKLRD